MAGLSRNKQLELYRIESFQAHMAYVRRAYLEPWAAALAVPRLPQLPWPRRRCRVQRRHPVRTLSCLRRWRLSHPPPLPGDRRSLWLRRRRRGLLRPAEVRPRDPHLPRAAQRPGVRQRRPLHQRQRLLPRHLHPRHRLPLRLPAEPSARLGSRASAPRNASDGGRAGKSPRPSPNWGWIRDPRWIVAVGALAYTRVRSFARPMEKPTWMDNVSMRSRGCSPPRRRAARR